MRRIGATTNIEYNPRTALLLCSRETAIERKIGVALVMHATYDILNFLRHGGRRGRDAAKQICEQVANSCEGSAASSRAIRTLREQSF